VRPTLRPSLGSHANPGPVSITDRATAINAAVFDDVWGSGNSLRQRFQLNLEIARKDFLYAMRRLRLPRKNAVVMDVGFGNGMLMFQFPPSATLFGTELSRHAIDRATARAKRRGYRRFEFLSPTAAVLPFASNICDIVIASHVIEHVTDDLAFIDEMLRTLKPQGHLILIFPLDATADRLLSEKELLNEAHARGHFHVRNYNLQTFLTRLGHDRARIELSFSDMFLWDWKCKLDSGRARLSSTRVGKVLDRAIAAVLNIPLCILPRPAFAAIDRRFQGIGYRPRQAIVVLRKKPT
jgi:ubiquinone/menaquinone biosynthesis C-methylase UbiE